MAHAHGITVYGATLIPFGGSADCTPEKDQIRVEINRRLMQEKLFDKIVDFDAAFAREENPYLAKEGYTSKDGGHPSPLGGLALAPVHSAGMVHRTGSICDRVKGGRHCDRKGKREKRRALIWKARRKRCGRRLPL